MKKIYIMLLTVMIICILAGCTQSHKAETIPHNTEFPVVSVTDPASSATTESIPKPPPTYAPDSEIILVAKVLRGECYDHQQDDKREVTRVICNRVSSGRFGSSIKAVVTAPRQFVEYRHDNVPTANDYIIAREILTQWYDGGCKPLGEYLFFSAESGHKNVFRKNY